LDQVRADADLHLELRAGMERGEAAEGGRQRADGDLLDHTETHRSGQARRDQAETGGFFELQQAKRVAEQHLPDIRQRDAARRTPERGTLGLEFEPLDLLASHGGIFGHRRGKGHGAMRGPRRVTSPRARASSPRSALPRRSGRATLSAAVLQLRAQ
jgi:hypothetical protein